MADNRELPSDSESEDEDYVPEGTVDLSEEESGSGSEEEPVAGSEQAGRKRKKSSSKKNKKRKAEEKENNEEKTIKEETPEELKKKSDALWAEFTKPIDNKKAQDETRVSGLTDEKENSEDVKPEASKVKVTQVFDFAGEKVQIEKEVNVKCQRAQTSTRGRGRGRGGSGLASILGQLGKKGKLSTLEKSKLDWDRFKKDEGIDEDLELHNKGKNGYLDRQDFLQRTDLRQFEIEKNMREAKRSFNR